ncbi:alpha/beta hydrolase [Nanoarchaeota archaeon]
MKRFLLLLILLVGCTSADINTEIKLDNGDYLVEGSQTAFLLTHGLAASPYEVKNLADYLIEKNFTVQVVRLAGHGTSLDDLRRTKWEEWYKSYEDAFLELSKDKRVYVGGTSLGALIALHLAENHNTAGVISLAAPLHLNDKKAKYAWIFKYLQKYADRELTEEEGPYYYPTFPVASVAEMVEIARITEKNLDQITEPVLVMQFSNDTRVSTESPEIIYNNIASEKKLLVLVNGTDHVLTMGPKKEYVFEKINQFISK